MTESDASDNLFDPGALPTPQLTQMLLQPAPQNRCVIHFTPRSGSSWLTGIIEQTTGLGFAREVFNPPFCAFHAEREGISSLEQYIDYVQKRDNHGGVFSFEITAHQMQTTFGDPALFRAYFASDPAFWLIREDIVAQAVSLAKMVTTQVGHSVEASVEQRAAADLAFAYDPEVLQQWLQHILIAERLSETWFAEWNIQPLRMSYEQITGLSPHQMLNLIARHAGLPEVPSADVKPRHAKMSTARNVEFAKRFRSEHADWLAPIEEERAQWLGKLDDIASIVRDL